MLYLGTSPSEPLVAELLDTHELGLMCQPGSNHPRAGWLWGGDNGCGPRSDGTVPEFTPKKYQRWLDWLNTSHPRVGCLFAAVPDVVGDHNGTLTRFEQYGHDVERAGWPVAFVGQDGATVPTTPWPYFDCYFVGGSTEWKMSGAFELAAEARRRGKWVHVGRVNSWRRYQQWMHHADSCDGTLLSYGPAKNIERIKKWNARYRAERANIVHPTR